MSIESRASSSHPRSSITKLDDPLLLQDFMSPSSPMGDVKLIHGVSDTVDALPEKQRYTSSDFLCTLISLTTYVVDVAMDVVVASYFFHLGVTHGQYHYWYFGLTLTFVLLPSLVMSGFSLRWYLLDADNPDLPSISMWRWAIRLLALALQSAPLLRYIDAMRLGLLSRHAERRAMKAETEEERHVWSAKKQAYYRLMVYEESDATLLRLFESFMESAPQLVLQLYILIKDPSSIQMTHQHYVRDAKLDPIIRTSVLVVSVVAALISIAWSLVVYQRTLRYSYDCKQNLTFMGSLTHFLWQLCSVTARVLALSLFASVYPAWVCVVCIAHALIMATWVWMQRTEVCRSKCEELLFGLVMGSIYVFCFFNAKEGPSRRNYILFYTFCFIENCALVTIWFLYAHADLQEGESNWYYYPAIATHYSCFTLGIVFMLLYYSCFHPNKSNEGDKNNDGDNNLVANHMANHVVSRAQSSSWPDHVDGGKSMLGKGLSHSTTDELMKILRSKRRLIVLGF